MVRNGYSVRFFCIFTFKRMSIKGSTLMKLIMTLLVRDEEDIIRANILYHLDRGVDFIIATDNNSRDSTPSILMDFQRQGCLHLISETDDDYSQSEWVTRMARMAATDFGADWIINSDADEFWWPLKMDLKNFFSEVPAECSIAIRLKGLILLVS